MIWTHYTHSRHFYSIGNIDDFISFKDCSEEQTATKVNFIDYEDCTWKHDIDNLSDLQTISYPFKKQLKRND